MSWLLFPASVTRCHASLPLPSPSSRWLWSDKRDWDSSPDVEELAGSEGLLGPQFRSLHTTRPLASILYGQKVPWCAPIRIYAGVTSKNMCAFFPGGKGHVSNWGKLLSERVTFRYSPFTDSQVQAGIISASFFGHENYWEHQANNNK